MTQGNPISMRYAIAATTAALAISYGPHIGGEETPMPSEWHRLQISNPQPWELDYGLSESLMASTAQDAKLRVVVDFTQRVLAESADLNPDIVRALKDDFWSLI